MRAGWKPLPSSTAPTIRSGSRSSRYGRPSISARPLLGVLSPTMVRIAVDLPAPLGPRKPVTTPGLTSKVRSSSAGVDPNRRERCWTWIMMSFRSLVGLPSMRFA